MPTRVQSTGKGRVQSGASATLTFGSLPEVGNLILVMVEGFTQVGNGWDAGDVTDNQGHTYALAITRSHSNSNPCAAIYYTVVATSSGTFTITLNQTAGSDWTAGSAVEYAADTSWDSGSCLTQSAGATGTGTAIATGSTAGSAAADEVAVAVCGIGATQASITVESVSPAWVEEHEELSWTQYVPGEGNTRVLTGSGTQSASWTAASSGNWAAVVATFQQVAAGGGSQVNSDVNTQIKSYLSTLYSVDMATSDNSALTALSLAAETADEMNARMQKLITDSTP